MKQKWLNQNLILNGAIGGYNDEISKLLWHMKKEGYAEDTIEATASILNMLVKANVNLQDPERIKEFIATQDTWSDGRKQNVIDAYDRYAKFYKIEWEKLKIKREEELPYIPQEREIDDLIAGCSKHVALALQIMKETGARISEVFSLKWTDIDLERKIITIRPKKGSNPRIFKISNKLISMLNKIPRDDERVFNKHKNVKNLRRTFERQRKKIADKLGNPKILLIHLDIGKLLLNIIKRRI